MSSIRSANHDRVESAGDSAGQLLNRAFERHRFAVLQSTCCCCGRALTEDRSKAYGVGPECREGMSPGRLKLISDQAAVEHARVLREAL